nr:uncharacterized protein LOC127304402 [Lolium perenne]
MDGDPPLPGQTLRATAGRATSRHHRAAAPAVPADAPAASAAIAGPLQQLLLSSPPPDAGLLQSPLPLSTISGPGATTGPAVPLLQQSAAFFPTGTLQQQQQQLPPPPTPPMQLLSSPMLSPLFGGQQQQQQQPSPPTPKQRLLPPPTPSLPFCGVGATLAPGSTSTPPGMPFHQVVSLYRRHRFRLGSLSATWRR